jgi:putative nucleotidyltransferase with HDIG domain
MKLAFTDSLTPGMLVAEDVLSFGQDLLFSRGTLLDERRIEMIKECGPRYIHVTNRLRSLYPERLIRVGAEFNVPQPPPLIARELQDEAIQYLEEMFTLTPDVGNLHDSAIQFVQQLGMVVEQLVETLTADENTLVNINDLRSYDEYTYHHSLSVAVLAIAIGQRLGYSDLQLNNLGKCAILHDIGKTAVPLEIIKKPARLTAQELDVMKTHALAGYHYLTECGVEEHNILAGVLHHHERVDGSGYPLGIAGDSIPLFGRVIAVADVYDALTSNRPYRQPNRPAEAVEYIMGGIDSSFDFDIVHAFVHKLDLYPIASFVHLSNGANAVVLDNKNQMRPVIRLLDTGEIIDLCDKRYHNLVVEGLLPEGSVIVGED